MGAFLISSLFLLSINTHADIIKDQELPYSVLAAIDLNYDIGRNSANFGGISNIFSYKINKKEGATLNSVISKIVKKQRDLKPSVVYAACNEANKSNLMTCAQWVVSNKAPQKQFLSFLGNLKAQLTGTDGASTLWKDSVDVIEKFLQASLVYSNDEFNEFTVGVNLISNIDAYVTILINKDLSRAVVVGWDYGSELSFLGVNNHLLSGSPGRVALPASPK